MPPSSCIGKLPPGCGGESRKKAAIIIAEGMEEMEYMIITDILRRCNINLTLAGLNGCGPVMGAHDILIMANTDLHEVYNNEYDAIILPGGVNSTKAMEGNILLGCILKNQDKNYKLICAISQAPTVLLANDIGFGRSITSYPAYEYKFLSKYVYLYCKVVHSGNLITSRGPGTAFDFALKIASELTRCSRPKDVAKMMLHTSFAYV